MLCLSGIELYSLWVPLITLKSILCMGQAALSCD